MSFNSRVPKRATAGLLKLPVSGYCHPERSLLVYVLADGSHNLRIYLPGEAFPIHLRRFLRQFHLRVHQSAQRDAEGKLISPALYSFHPRLGVLILIEPEKPTFYVRDAAGEREIQRDGRGNLVLS